LGVLVLLPSVVAPNPKIIPSIVKAFNIKPLSPALYIPWAYFSKNIASYNYM